MTKILVDLSAKNLKRFAVDEIAPRLGSSYRLYGRRALVRARGPCYQLVILSKSRGNSLRIHPSLFVVGADPCFPVISGALSLWAVDWRAWTFLEAPLNDSLARTIIDRLRLNSPISFFSELLDIDIDGALSWFQSRHGHWSVYQSWAFFNICRGVPSVRDDLARAKKSFYSQVLSRGTPSENDKRLELRITELEARLDRDDCIALCRADAERHALQLKLPPVEWPPEWPTT